MYFATGNDFPDVLVAGIENGLSGERACPTLFLIGNDNPDLSMLDYAKEKYNGYLWYVTFLGGDTVITPATRTAVIDAMGTVPIMGD